MAEPSIEAARAMVEEAAGALGHRVEFSRMAKAEVHRSLGREMPLSHEVIELWTLATPVRVSVPFAPDRLDLYSPVEVAERNAGYFGESWRPEWIVFGDVAGDPVIADTGEPGTPIKLAMHGMGTWQPAKVAPSPAVFLAAVAAWLRVLHRFDGERLDEDNDFVVKPGFDDALAAELRLVLDNECVSALVSYIET